METAGIILGLSHIGIAILICLMSIPLVKGKVAMNKFYGIRFKKSYESEEKWYEINKYGGKLLIIWSIPLAILGFITFFLPLEGNKTLVIIIASAPTIIIIPAIQCYIFAKNL
jgi:hypothetical protein